MTDMESTLETEAKTKQGGLPEYQEADHEAEAQSNEAEPSEEIPGGMQTTDPTFADGAMEVNSTPWNPPGEPAAEPAAETEADTEA